MNAPMQFPPNLHDLDVAGFRRLAEARLFEPATEPMGDFAINPEFRDWVMKQATKPAAVLIPVVEGGDSLSVILTKRTEKLASHSGQVAFPGGKIDRDDGGPVEAALREANEEIGLDAGRVDVLGVMPEYLTGSGYRISPVVALVEENPQLVANHDEVEYIFEVPLGFLLDTANHRVGSRVFQGRRRHYLEMPYGEHYIWGVTAGIIKHFQQRLAGDPAAGWDG